MNQTLQLTDYIPQYVSLYYVDYRDDLDEHEDIQEECIRSNNMEKLYEKAYEWYEEQESSNMHDYLEETRKNRKRTILPESLKSMKMKSGNLSTTGTIPTR